MTDYVFMSSHYHPPHTYLSITRGAYVVTKPSLFKAINYADEAKQMI